MNLSELTVNRRLQALKARQRRRELAKERERFELTWRQHINELVGLGWNLSPEDFEVLRGIMAQLRGLVDSAGAEYERQQQPQD